MMHTRIMGSVVAAFGIAAAGGLASQAAEPANPRRETVRVVAADGPDRDARQPQAAVDPKGRIFVAFGRGNDVRCAVSSDGGKTFDLVRVGSTKGFALGMRRGPRIAATDSAVVVTAVVGEHGRGHGGEHGKGHVGEHGKGHGGEHGKGHGGEHGKGRDGDVVAWRSTDGGKTWTGPIRVNAVEGSAREGLHGMAAGPDGSIFCTWLDLRHQRTEIYGARSRDGGATWETDGLVYRSPDRSVCECCHPSAAYGPDGTLYVMWRNQLKGARDMYLARSPDGGKTFGSAEKLGQGTWPLNACPMDGGAVAAGTDGGVTTVWMRAGAMFAARPGEVERELGRGVQGWTAIGPEGPYSVWLEKRPGKLMVLTPGGRTPLTLDERANDPVVAAAPGGRGPVVAVWEKPERGGIVSMVLAPSANVAGH